MKRPSVSPSAADGREAPGSSPSRRRAVPEEHDDGWRTLREQDAAAREIGAARRRSRNPTGATLPDVGERETAIPAVGPWEFRVAVSRGCANIR